MTQESINRRKIYSVWLNMKSRCQKPSHKQFYRYGGRGISVSDTWKDFIAFYGWAIASGWRLGLQIDRRNNDGNYCPENCRFVTQTENLGNRKPTYKFIRAARIVAAASGPKAREAAWCVTRKPVMCLETGAVSIGLNAMASLMGISSTTVHRSIRLGRTTRKGFTFKLA